MGQVYGGSDLSTNMLVPLWTSHVFDRETASSGYSARPPNRPLEPMGSVANVATRPGAPLWAISSCGLKVVGDEGCLHLHVTAAYVVNLPLSDTDRFHACRFEPVGRARAYGHAGLAASTQDSLRGDQCQEAPTAWPSATTTILSGRIRNRAG
jgi:hypothetical protein